MGSKYDIHMDDKYGQSRLIDVAAEAAAHQPWFNQTLTTVNDSVVRLGLFQGEFHWHKHDDGDEFFLLLDGDFRIELEDRTVELRSRQAFTVPKGVLHRPVVHRRSAVLMIETAHVVPTGD